jgi:hypothetical protein
VLEALAESGAANDETIVTTRIRTSHQTTPSLPRRRPKQSPPPKTVPLVIERTGDRKVIERSVAERLMSEHATPEVPAEADQPAEPATVSADDTADSPAEQH